MAESPKSCRAVVDEGASQIVKAFILAFLGLWNLGGGPLCIVACRNGLSLAGTAKSQRPIRLIPMSAWFAAPREVNAKMTLID